MKSLGFNITIEVGHTVTDFLDVTLDLRKDSYKPYHKPNNTISYIDRGSNHPWHVKKSLPGMIEKRLNTLSKDENTFNEAKGHYQASLKRSNHPDKLEFRPDTYVRKNRRTRKKQCIFFNPPYCMSTKTNVGKSFLQLVDKHFGADSVYHQIFNRSTVKISYCCMANVKSIIRSHNQKVLNRDTNDDTRGRNRTCPLQGHCKTKNVIYEAMVTTERSTRTYIGSTGRSFKERYNEHTSSFNTNTKKTTKTKARSKKDDKPTSSTQLQTTNTDNKDNTPEQQTQGTKNKAKEPKVTQLTKHILSLKRKKIKYEISWRLLQRMNDNSKRIAKVCQTCNLERWEIATADRKKILNHRSELTGKCPHFKGLYF